MPDVPPPLISPGDRSAIASVLLRYYPTVFRIAVALSGSEKIAGQTTHIVLRQSLGALSKWVTEADAARWFAHHTVLTVRRIAPAQYNPAADPLLKLTSDATFVTLLRTLHFLPAQQREAFLLHHGEGFTLRQLATAMDCSSEAASNHLVAAAAALQPIADSRLGDFSAALPSMLSALLPPHNKIAFEINKESARNHRRRQLKRWLIRPLIFFLLAALAWCIWKICSMIVI